MNISSIAGLAIVWGTMSFPVEASFVLSQTRIIYNESRPATPITVHNRHSTIYAGQAWIEKEVKTPGPLIAITPSVFKIAADNRIVLRLMATDSSQAITQELLYSLSVQEIPPKSTSQASQLLLTQITKIKVLYRPEKLPERKEAEKKIQVTQEGKDIRFKNTTPFYFAIVEVTNEQQKKLNDHDRLGTFAPYSEVTLSSQAPTGHITIKYIDDFGATHSLQLPVTPGKPGTPATFKSRSSLQQSNPQEGSLQ